MTPNLFFKQKPRVGKNYCNFSFDKSWNYVKCLNPKKMLTCQLILFYYKRAYRKIKKEMHGLRIKTSLIDRDYISIDMKIRVTI